MLLVNFVASLKDQSGLGAMKPAVERQLSMDDMVAMEASKKLQKARKKYSSAKKLFRAQNRQEANQFAKMNETFSDYKPWKPGMSSD